MANQNNEIPDYKAVLNFLKSSEQSDDERKAASDALKKINQRFKDKFGMYYKDIKEDEEVPFGPSGHYFLTLEDEIKSPFSIVLYADPPKTSKPQYLLRGRVVKESWYSEPIPVLEQDCDNPEYDKQICNATLN